MKLSRFYLLLLTVLLVIISFLSCQKSVEQNSPSDSTDISEDYTSQTESVSKNSLDESELTPSENETSSMQSMVSPDHSSTDTGIKRPTLTPSPFISLTPIPTPTPKPLLGILDKQTATAIVDLMKTENDLWLDANNYYAKERYLGKEEFSEKLLVLAEKAHKVTDTKNTKDDHGTVFGKALSELKSGGTLYVPAGEYQISKNITIPENVLIVIENGAKIHVSDGYTMTINGYVDAYPYPVFISGNFAGRSQNGYGYPEWFGAVGNAVENDSIAVSKTLEIFGIADLTSSTRGYVLENISLKDNQGVSGMYGSKLTRIIPATGKLPVFKISGSNVSIENLEFQMQKMEKGISTIEIDTASRSVENIEIRNCFVESGYTFLSAEGTSGQWVKNLRVFEVDIRNVKAPAYILKNIMYGYLRHCIVDLNVLSTVQKHNVDYPGFYFENTIGLVAQQSDVLGSWLNGKGGHGFVFKDSAALFLDRLYSDTINGKGYIFENVHYAELFNCGVGLQKETGLHIINCSEFKVDVFKCYGRKELEPNDIVDGILIENSRNMHFTNVQSLAHGGDALIIRDSEGIRFTNYISYLNNGLGLNEKGNSNNNYMQGVFIADPKNNPPYKLTGSNTGINGFTHNTGTYGPSSRNFTEESVGNYVQTQVKGHEYKTDMELVAKEYEKSKVRVNGINKRHSGLRADSTQTNYFQSYHAIKSKLVSRYTKSAVTASGAKGDGKSDDTAAISKALQDNRGGFVFLSKGVYKIKGNLTLTANTVLFFESGAVVELDEGSLRWYGFIDALPENIFTGEMRGLRPSGNQNRTGYPQWFGAKGNGQTDDTLALQRTMHAFDNISVPYTDGGYLLSELTPNQHNYLYGYGLKAPKLIAMTATQNLFKIFNWYIKVEYVDIDMLNSAKGSVCFFFDNSAKGLSNFRFKNITVNSPYTVVRDMNTKNKFFIPIVHFEAINIKKPRDVSFELTDFFGFIFFRDVVIDYEKIVTNYNGINATTNFGMIMENTTVKNAGAGSTGDGFSFKDSWAIWTNNLTAKDLGGTGFVSSGTYHCYFVNMNAINCKNAANFSGKYFQVHNFNAVSTESFNITGSMFFNVSDVLAQNEKMAAMNVNSSKGGIFSTVDDFNIKEDSNSEYNIFLIK